MIGFNGGLFGKRKTTAAGLSIPGVWTLREQLEAKRSLSWAGSPLLLDIFLGSTAAYSLRNLRVAYSTSPVVRVRRSTDSSEENFTADQVIDTTSTGMLAWVKQTSSTASGFVTTWYDQSGSNNHAVQATESLQPRIVSSGVLETDGVKPSILFGQASGVYLQPPSLGGIGANCAFFSVTKHTNPASNWSFFIGERVGGQTMIIGKRQGSSTLHVVGFGGGGGDFAGANISQQSIGYWQQGTGISRYLLNNTGGSLGSGSNTSDFRIGNRGSNGNEVWVGYISEIIYFPNSQINTYGSTSFTMNKYYNYYTAVSATGGNVATEDKLINNILYRVHTFNTVGVSSFVVTNGGIVEYLVIAGGGGGGSGYQGGGGGAGGLLTGTLPITSGSFNITVGDGGFSGSNGVDSNFDSITAIGGGRGSSERSGYPGAAAGGSGGGGGHGSGSYAGGAASPAGQGFAGGAGTTANFSCGGGGGAAGTGETADGDEVGGAAGGVGLPLNFNGVITTYSTGGKGSRRNDNTTGVTGASNTGNGGGGSSSTVGNGTGAKGGSGVVIIRYPI